MGKKIITNEIAYNKYRSNAVLAYIVYQIIVKSFFLSVMKTIH